MNLSPHFSKNQFLNGKSEWHEIFTTLRAFHHKTFCRRISSIKVLDAEKLSFQFSKIEFWKTFFSHTPMSSTLERKLQFQNGFQTNILRLKTNRIIYITWFMSFISSSCEVIKDLPSPLLWVTDTPSLHQP
jgi:hypothetical protein